MLRCNVNRCTDYMMFYTSAFPRQLLPPLLFPSCTILQHMSQALSLPGRQFQAFYLHRTNQRSQDSIFSVLWLLRQYPPEIFWECDMVVVARPNLQISKHIKISYIKRNRMKLHPWQVEKLQVLENHDTLLLYLQTSNQQYQFLQRMVGSSRFLATTKIKIKKDRFDNNLYPMQQRKVILCMLQKNIFQNQQAMTIEKPLHHLKIISSFDFP